MLQQVNITHFQSLHSVALPLGSFTVIVGRTDSGKSAFIRALQTLTSNRRGSGFITRGERTAVIEATTPTATVTLRRGVSSDDKDNRYTITPHDGTAPQVHTKLNAQTPLEVSRALGIPSTDPLNYALQFDSPYLLKESPGEVARVLGALTNVHILFEAAREASTRKTRATATHKTKAQDLARLSLQLAEFDTLPTQLADQQVAEDHLSQARQAAHQLATLSSAIQSLSAAHKRAVQLQPLAEATVPDIDALRATHSRLASLSSTIDALRTAATRARTAQATDSTATAELDQLDTSYTEALRAAGECPTCHQSTLSLSHSHN